MTNPTAGLDAFIEKAVEASERYPDEWILFYVLNDKYQANGSYELAVRVSKRCVELRPDDLRSVYAHATAYNLLTRASLLEDEKLENIIALFKSRAKDMGEIFDPHLSKTEADKLGISIETAATQAMRWFEITLSLNPNLQGRAQIEWDIQTLYDRFPQLKH